MIMNSNVTGSSPDPLLNASLTTGSGLGPTTGDTTAPPQAPPPTAKTSTATVAPSDKILEGVDILDSGGVVVQQLPEQLWGRKDYQADSSQPMLVLPDPEGAERPQPLGLAEQKAMNNVFFPARVKEGIAKKFEESGGSPAFAQELFQKFQESGDGVAFIQGFFQGGTEKDSTGVAKKPGTPVEKEGKASKKEGETDVEKTSVSGKEAELGVGTATVSGKEGKPAVGKEGESSGKESEPGVGKEGMPSGRESAPQLPLPVFNAVANIIVQAAMTGKISELGEDAKKIAKTATEQTQEAWKLPKGENGWQPGTQDIKKLTPTSNVVVPPINIDNSRKEVVAKNVEQLCTSLDQVGNKVMTELPPNDPKRIAVADLIRIIANAIRDLKYILQELQKQDSDISTLMSKSKFDEIDTLKGIIEQNNKKIDEAAESRAKQAKMSKVMKILAPIIAAIMVVVAIVSLVGAIFTGGASIALAVAALAVASFMFAYTVADSAFDITSKIVSAFNSLMEKINPPWLRTLVKAMVLVVLVAILVVAVAASGGSAAGSIAAQVAAQVAKQLTIQLTIMFIMSSNILPELVVDALVKFGAIDPNDEKTKMIVQMVVMAVAMVATLGIVAKGQGAIRAIGNTIAEGAKSVGRAIVDIGAAVVKLAKIATEQGLKAAIAELLQMLQNLQRMLTQLMRQAGNAAGEALGAAIDKAKNAAKEFGAALSRAGTTAKASLTNAKEAIAAAAERFLDTLKQLDKVLLDVVNKAGEQTLQQLKEIAKSTAESLKNFAVGLKELVPYPNLRYMAIGAIEIFDPRPTLELTKKVIDSALSGVKLSAAELDQASKQILKTTQQAQDFFKLAQLSVEVGGSIYIGVIGLDLVRILKEQGSLEAAKEVTETMIKLFQKLLDSFQEGLSARGEWINSLDQAIASLYGSASQTSTTATQQQISS
jgi:hypothetical protein